MRTIKARNDLLIYLDQERQAWEALVARVGTDQMDVPGVMGPWTFRDLIAHLTAWWRREYACGVAALRGEQPLPHPAPAEVELINYWIYYTNRDRPLPDLIRDADAVWQEFEALIRSADEQVLLETGRFPWLQDAALGPQLLGDFVDHYHNDHEADVQAWLERHTV